MIAFRTLLKEGRDRLYEAGAGEQAAMLFMTELCRKADINLYMDMDSSVPEGLQTDYLEGIHRMELGEPLSYVLGYESFYGYDFHVNQDVLIPRPETEELVGLVLSLIDEHFEEKEHVSVCDVATGCGAIGITLSLEEPRVDVIASDISDKALEVAWKNNETLHGRCNFLLGDMLEPFIERDLHFDVMVCNPPYIPKNEVMEHSVVDFEPHLALFGGQDGLKFYRQFFEKADQVIRPGGVMAFEMGYDQGDRLSALARSYFPEAEITVHKDLAGKDRMLSVVLPMQAAE